MHDTRTDHDEGALSVRPSGLADARVADAMRTGTLTCPPTASLREVARTMATHHIHCVIVEDADDTGRPWAVLSDLDLVGAARAEGGEDVSAGDVAATEALTVTRDDTLEHAAQLMSEHEVAHLIVVDADTGRPAGMLSTLDIAGTLARGGA